MIIYGMSSGHWTFPAFHFCHPLVPGLVKNGQEHQKLKELLQPRNLENFAKIRQNMSSCITEAFRLKLIGPVEKKRLQVTQ